MGEVKAWWGRRSRKGRIGIISAAVLIGLVALGAVAGEDKKPAAEVAAPIAKPTPQPVAKTEPKTRIDTGRMSDTEYSEWLRVVGKFESELSDYGSKIGTKCRVLLEAAALADASDCISEAWSGVWDAALVAFSTSEDMISSTAKTCRLSLTGFKNRLDRYGSAQKRAAEAGENLDFDTFTIEVKRSISLQPAYTKERAKVTRVCAPT